MKKKYNIIKRLRRAVAVILVLIVLLLSVGLIMHLVMRSDLPRIWTERILASQFGIKAVINELQLDGGGHTRIQGVQILPPAGDTAVLRIDSIDLTHRSLLRILLTRSLGLRSIRVDKPQLYIQQDPNGLWNIQRLVSQISTGKSPTRSPPLLRSLPQMEITDMQVKVTDANGLRLAFADSQFHGQSQGTDQWTFSGNLGASVFVDGTLRLDAGLEHTLQVRYEDADGLLNPWLKIGPGTVQGQWQGRVTKAGLSGIFQLQQAHIPPYTANGLLTVEAGLRYAVIDVNELAIHVQGDHEEILQGHGGRVTWQGDEGILGFAHMVLSGFDGSLTADVIIPLANPRTSVGHVDLKGLDLARLSRWYPVLTGCQGKVSGRLKSTMAQPPSQAPEPLVLEMNVDIQDGLYKTAELHKAQVTAYVGPNRCIIDKSYVELLRGTARIWTRTSQHDNERLTYINADFNDIDLHQTLRAFDINTEKAVGKASGKGMVIMRSGSGMTGEMEVYLQKADLVNTAVIGALYNALKLKIRDKAPTGEGRVKLALEGHSLQILSFVYFDRGLEVRGAGMIDDLAREGQSSIDGYAMGSTRPLKGMKLPGLREVDRLMASLQDQVTTVRIKGTLDRPQVTVVPFAQLQKTLRILLLSQLGT